MEMAVLPRTNTSRSLEAHAGDPKTGFQACHIGNGAVEDISGEV